MLSFICVYLAPVSVLQEKVRSLAQQQEAEGQQGAQAGRQLQAALAEAEHLALCCKDWQEQLHCKSTEIRLVECASYLW